jgi:ribonuclease H / adenosylcobalamin/alpha-ribazole phosphatase
MSLPEISPLKVNRELIADRVFDILMSVPGVFSVTFVGSFCDRDDLSVISDIDTIVICEELDEIIFQTCVDGILALCGSELGFPGRTVKVNPTFGPLKFDSEDIIVVHLMIYDREGHRDHVLKSPFTCYDWERSVLYRGPSLAEIYPVLRLQPRDFQGARRGMANYLDDLEKGVISYRKYEFKDGHGQQVEVDHHLDERHKGEYAYHIARNLVLNYLKMVRGENVLYNDEELGHFWAKEIPSCTYFIPFFNELRSIKLKRSINFPRETIDRVRAFIIDFELAYRARWIDGAKPLVFVRHGVTSLNDGSFLGQGRNPDILDPSSVHPLNNFRGQVFSSPLQRALSTAKRLAPSFDAVPTTYLTEIDYGEAEGLHFGELATRYPELHEAWSRGEDAPFPNGECTHDVLSRLHSFLELVQKSSEPMLAVSHNVVLRCLVGEAYGLPMKCWFQLVIPHGIPLELLQDDLGRLRINLSREAKAVVTDSWVQWKVAESL